MDPVDNEAAKLVAVEQFLAMPEPRWGNVGLAKADVRRRVTVDEQYEVARAWLAKWGRAIKAVSAVVHDTLDAHSPRPMQR